MPSSHNEIITIGHFYKITCDALGLWKSDDKEIDLDISANEKEKSKAFKKALDSLMKSKGSFNLYVLEQETTNNAPKNKELSMKLKSIQKTVQNKSKDDFSSYEEIGELNEQVATIIDESFDKKLISDFAKRFVSLSLMYFSEFNREHISTNISQAQSQKYFKDNILMNLINLILEELLSCEPFYQVKKNDEWPLKAFVNYVAEISGVSLHKLHQFHEMKLDINNQNCSDLVIWGKDFTSKPINDRNKQLINKLGKNNKIKWDSFYKSIKPFVCLLPRKINEEQFATVAFSAFIAHNLNLTYSDITSPKDSGSNLRYPSLNLIETNLPVSMAIDTLFHKAREIDKVTYEYNYDKLLTIHKNYIQEIQRLGMSSNIDMAIPSAVQFIYSDNLEYFPIEILYHKYGIKSLWIKEWLLARNAIESGHNSIAFNHFKRAFDEAKYVSGPLFIPLYIQICAFIKQQYRIMKSRGEEKLYEKNYEPLGSAVTSYAKLLGYSSYSKRNSITNFWESFYPLKQKKIISKIDLMVENF